MSVFIVVNYELRYDKAPASRALHITKYLQKKGIFTVLVGIDSLDPMVEEQIESPVKVKRRFEGKLGYVLVKFPFLAIEFRSFLRGEMKNAIIRNHWQGLLLMPLAKIFNVRIFYNFHGYGYIEQRLKGRTFKPYFTKFFEELCLKSCDFVLTQNLHNIELAKKMNENVLYLDNGVDTDTFTVDENIEASEIRSTKERFKIPDKEFIVGFVANVAQLMDLDCMLKSTRSFDPDIHFVVVGSGQQLDRIDAETYPNVTFTGRIDHGEIGNILRTFDICIYSLSPSVAYPFHGSPRKLKEWIAMGIPVIMTDINPKPPYLRSGKNVIFIDSNEPKTWAGAVNTLARDEQLLQEMRQENMSLRDSISWDHVIEASGLLDALKRE
jgi:glycosyltransferase involved in cell wall biosynthesis